ncbi:MAG: hypothetical protein AAFQ58_11390 [Pseudomonadota bacterium]
MIRFAIATVLTLAAAPAIAQETKEESCALQAEVVAAIQQARLDRVREREVQDHILAQDPTWPEKFNNAIPLITPWVYEQKRRVIRNEDLGAAWSELCLQQ